jgi:RNA polymerase sigma-70 factor (ECF subfamily)
VDGPFRKDAETCGADSKNPLREDSLKIAAGLCDDLENRSRRIFSRRAERERKTVFCGLATVRIEYNAALVRLYTWGLSIQMSQAATGVATTPDETLVELAGGGDASAREELFRRHFAIAHRVAYRLLGHEQDALDAVQDGFLKAALHLEDFDGRSGFRTWLLRIVTNAALDSGRKRKRRTTLHLDDGVGDPAGDLALDDPTRRLHAEDLRNALNAALARLSADTRATFVLFAEAGLSYKEIAETQHLPVGTVMSRLHYARHKLQEYLADVDY